MTGLTGIIVIHFDALYRYSREDVPAEDKFLVEGAGSSDSGHCEAQTVRFSGAFGPAPSSLKKSTCRVVGCYLILRRWISRCEEVGCFVFRLKSNTKLVFFF